MSENCQNSAAEILFSPRQLIRVTVFYTLIFMSSCLAGDAKAEKLKTPFNYISRTNQIDGRNSTETNSVHLTIPIFEITKKLRIIIGGTIQIREGKEFVSKQEAPLLIGAKYEF